MCLKDFAEENLKNIFYPMQDNLAQQSSSFFFQSRLLGPYQKTNALHDAMQYSKKHALENPARAFCLYALSNPIYVLRSNSSQLCQLLNSDIFLNEFMTFSWKCHNLNSDIYENMSEIHSKICHSNFSLISCPSKSILGYNLDLT